MRLKRPAQPLVFSFPNVTCLCAAAADLYGRRPGMPAWLCVYEGKYYLAVHALLRERPEVKRTAGKYGVYRGAAPVFFAYCAEHGHMLSRNAVTDLGRLFF